MIRFVEALALEFSNVPNTFPSSKNSWTDERRALQTRERENMLHIAVQPHAEIRLTHQLKIYVGGGWRYFTSTKVVPRTSPVFLALTQPYGRYLNEWTTRYMHDARNVNWLVS